MATYANASASGAGNQIAALKELYEGGDYMKDLVYKKNPFYALVPKDESPEGFAGKYIPVPVIYGPSIGRSATFSTAQTNQSPTAISSFFVYRVSNYGLATITNELIEATVGNAGAFIDEAKLQVDSAIRNLSNDIAGDLFRGGTGTRGQIGNLTNGATATVVLADVSQVTQFEVGMVIVAAATDGGAPGSQTLTITTINRNNGTIAGTASANPFTDPGWAAGGYLQVQGDVSSSGASTTSTALKTTGLAAWLAPTVSSSDSFWGVNRSADQTRLAGVFYDGSAQSIEEALIDAGALVAREGGEPDMCFLSFATWSALEKELGAKVQYVQVQHDKAEIAFKGIQVNMPYGPVTVIPDRNCLPKTAFLLSMDTWKLRSLGRSPHILTYGREGLEGVRVYNADALEVRVGSYHNLICNAPGWNCRVALNA